MPEIHARIVNARDSHEVELRTDGRSQRLSIGSGASGYGSAANGGELLFLALATCYCNDLHREASKRGIRVARVVVEVRGSFPHEGAAARDVTYTARVEADASEEDIRDLMWHTDTVAEIQNTIRASVPVSLAAVSAVSTAAGP
jgi:organic hydroperoxide reductase OsmC/OhrA